MRIDIWHRGKMIAGTNKCNQINCQQLKNLGAGGALFQILTVRDISNCHCQEKLRVKNVATVKQKKFLEKLPAWFAFDQFFLYLHQFLIVLDKHTTITIKK